MYLDIATTIVPLLVNSPVTVSSNHVDVLVIC